jgi:gamma-glutamylcyclotransferase (GGCT)/AIG2-like uncharacterized protein YtfP
MLTKVFVYGTLKRGNLTKGLDQRNAGVTFVGSAVTSSPTYSLYDLGSCPAAVLSGDSYISGEVWLIDDRTMYDLDQIEGYPACYKRTQVDTTQGRAWIYHIPNIEKYNASSIEPSTNRIISWRE